MASEVQDRVEAALRLLKEHGSERVREEMAVRYGIAAEKAFGTPMAKIRVVSRSFGRDHELASALWETGWYEARLLTSLVADPALVTPEQMDRWRADFDNWAVTDTLCFHLFDRTPHAVDKVGEWVLLDGEFERRAGFALLASLALHRKDVPDSWFAEQLPLLEAGARDERNFVKKAVSWALRAIGGRRGADLNQAATALAERLAASPDRTARWIGKDALKALAKSARK